ncbi:transporter [Ciceribacter thiooxidans]|uniref:Transporter n=1 Tax=Ciceribacter thiooxidans TaxID=1969821 RepID=A0ABV7I0X7_9HYPH|nr:transporter [Ciceribacter thiooxidans]MDI6838223.1 transporter [Rhizobiaceae bacterium]
MLASLSPGLWLALTGTPLLIATGQVLFKLTSGTTGDLSVRGLVNLALNPLLVSALAIYGAGTLIWIYVLKSVPLTLAYSFMGLTFFFVPLLAQMFLGETITLRYVIGTVLIIAGLITINT